MTVAIDANFNARQAGKTGTQDRDTLAAELQKFSAKDVQGAWSWLDNLRYLRRLLSTPDLDSATGLKEYESVTTGDLGRKAPVENPPLLRLLDKGFFNPEGGFDLAFFEEMAHKRLLAGRQLGGRKRGPDALRAVRGTDGNQRTWHISAVTRVRHHGDGTVSRRRRRSAASRRSG